MSDVEINVIEDEGKIYFPIKYLSEKVLLRKGSIISQTNLSQYSKYIKEFKVDYGYKTGGIQNVKHISKEGLKYLFERMRIGRLNEEKRERLNCLLKYLEIPLVTEEKWITNKPDKNKIIYYDQYIKDCIKESLKDNSNMLWQKCSKCGNYYPLHKIFWGYNLHSSKEFYTVCKNCEVGSGRISLLNNRYFDNIYYKYGDEVYIWYKNNDIIKIYEHHLKYGDSKTLPEAINNKEDMLTIIKYLHNKGDIDKDNLGIEMLLEKFKINIYPKLDIYNIYEIFIKFL